MISISIAQNAQESTYQYAQPVLTAPKPTQNPITVIGTQEPISLEKPIDKSTYILGPGDVLGINILFNDNWTGDIQVSPTGDILIPGFGVLNVTGITLDDATKNIQKFVQNKYSDARINTTLIKVRTFKILILGAVLQPGYVAITPSERLLDIINLAGGLHKFSDPNNVQIERSSGKIDSVSVKSFLLSGNVNENPTLLEGDKIIVPFIDEFKTSSSELVTLSSAPITVSGFVNLPGAYQFSYGYTVGDYIGIAGGASEMGSIKSGVLFRNNEKYPLDLNQYVRSGDQIYIGEKFINKLLGKSSMMQTITALTSIYLTYLSRIKK